MNPVTMKPKKQTTPTACIHDASAMLSSPTPAIKKAIVQRASMPGRMDGLPRPASSPSGVSSA